MNLPQGGRELLAMRLAGKCPEFSVLVSDDGQMVTLHRAMGLAALRIEPGRCYDMRQVHGLAVNLVARSVDVLGVLECIAEARPSFLAAWVGEEQWLEFCEWEIRTIKELWNRKAA